MLEGKKATERKNKNAKIAVSMLCNVRLFLIILVTITLKGCVYQASFISFYKYFVIDSSTSLMQTVGSKRATTEPSFEIRNLVKFHFISGLFL